MINGFDAGEISRHHTPQCVRTTVCDTMIHNEATIKYAGYDPRELSGGSNKRVCCVCDVCGRVRWAQFRHYYDVCHLCARTDERARKISEAKRGVPQTAAHRKKIGDAHRGKRRTPFTDDTRAKMSDSHIGIFPTDEHRQHISATHQGIPYEDWTGFVANGAYCEKFDDACRDRIRAKYDYKCYICNLSQTDNITKTGKHKKLCVHHVDKNKDQGCNDVQWKLVPLCMRCHPGSHRDPIKSRLEYLLNDEDV